MSRARHLTAHALVLGLSLGAPLAAGAQTGAASWQSTPASILKSVLRNVVAAQDKYRTSHPMFANTVEALHLNPGADVKVQILNVTSNSWRAKATHRSRPGRSCVVFVGNLSGTELPKTDGDAEVAGEERVPLCDRME
ncbi:MAG TPA: hypothetical protein VHH32_11850 [Gemmatimonadales bacterium]|nr:hypothetical protein [Gemmatimonadales bacterium]